MIKLYGYELRRLLLNKFFIGLLLITGFYSYQILGGDIIRGVAHTAPFSAWSYGAFLAAILPFLLIAQFLFIGRFHSKAEKQVKVLTDAAPIDPFRYALLRGLAIVTGCGVISIFVVGISFVFYARVLAFTDYWSFVLPLLLTLVPAMLVMLGIGWLAAQVHPGLLLVLMLLVLILGQLPLPYSLDLLGGRFFREYPLTLSAGPDGEPGFTIPVAVWLGKAAYCFVGIGLSWLGLLQTRRIRKTRL